MRHLPSFYPLFVDLMHCDSKELRQILREIFSQRIGTVLHERQQTLLVAAASKQHSQRGNTCLLAADTA